MKMETRATIRWDSMALVITPRTPPSAPLPAGPLPLNAMDGTRRGFTVEHFRRLHKHTLHIHAPPHSSIRSCSQTREPALLHPPYKRN
jgi:hypothetical protein